MRRIRVIMLVGVLVMFASTAWAGNMPEFDAVGCDNYNIFAGFNWIQYGQVIDNNVGPYGKINEYSIFYELIDNELVEVEKFEQTAGQLFPDPCFPYMDSALTDAWNEAYYEWWIVLQMKPESDINLNIYDCVLKHNFFDPWGEAEQTGRYRAPWGQLMFVPSANPLVTVWAYPGEYATPGFESPFYLDARTLPGLSAVPMNGKLYTSKAIWDEEILLILPETGLTNASGETIYNLKQGDRIRVRIEIPPANNTADIRYGQDSVLLKYIGITGTWYYGEPCET